MDQAIFPAEGKYLAPALTKGLEIIEALSEHAEGLSLKELSAQLGRTTNELFRMVMVLQEHRYIRATEAGKYCLTLRLFAVAHRYPPIRSLIELALPEMRNLALAVRQSCHLSVYHDGHAMIVAQVESPERWSFGLKVGAFMEMSATASGVVLLAFQPETVLSRMLGERRSVENEELPSAAAVRREIQSTRKRGYSIMPSRQVAGVTNVAFPILGYENCAIAALNVPYVERIDLKSAPALSAVSGHIRTTALAISALAGHLASSTRADL